MSPKISLFLLICFCVVLGLANGDYRKQNPQYDEQHHPHNKRRHNQKGHRMPNHGIGVAGRPRPSGPPGPSGRHKKSGYAQNPLMGYTIISN